jgi:hypothetical protein
MLKKYWLKLDIQFLPKAKGHCSLGASLSIGCSFDFHRFSLIFTFVNCLFNGFCVFLLVFADFRRFVWIFVEFRRFISEVGTYISCRSGDINDCLSGDINLMASPLPPTPYLLPSF